VIKTAIGPHLTLLIEKANCLDAHEKKIARFGTPSGLTLTERIPPPRKRKLGEQPRKKKLEAVIQVTQRYPHPSKSHAQSVRDTEATKEPPKRRVIQAAKKW
jgi:hypothetical protein